MENALSWTWVLQAIILILTVAGSVASIAALVLHRRPQKMHVIHHAVNTSWEEVKAQIEAHSPVKVEWIYHGTANSRSNDGR